MPNQGGTHSGTHSGTQGQHVKAGQQSRKNDDGRQERQAAAPAMKPAMKDDDRHRGGSGNFAEDRQRASEAGRKGGKH